MTEGTGREEIVSRLKGLIDGHSGIEVDVASIVDETRIQDVGFDSISILDFLYEMETEFGLPLDVRDLVDVKTVSDLIDLLQAKLRE